MGKTMAPFLERSIIMLDQYTIGELSKKTGLSIHTIRYYDNIDLLKPGSVDEKTVYIYKRNKAENSSIQEEQTQRVLRKYKAFRT